MKQLRREIFIDFPAQTANLYIDHVGLRIKVIVPDRLEQHRAGNHLALVPHQVFEKAELARLKGNGRASALGPPRSQIQSQISDPQFLIILSLRAATEQCFGACKKLGESKGLGQIIVAAATQTADSFVEARERAQDQHWCRLTEFSNRGDNRQSIHLARQHAIENDDVPPLVCGEVKAVDPIANQSGRMASLLEPVTYIAGRVRFILYDQTAHSAPPRRYRFIRPVRVGARALRPAGAVVRTRRSAPAAPIEFTISSGASISKLRPKPLPYLVARSKREEAVGHVRASRRACGSPPDR